MGPQVNLSHWGSLPPNHMGAHGPCSLGDPMNRQARLKTLTSRKLSMRAVKAPTARLRTCFEKIHFISSQVLSGRLTCTEYSITC